MLSGIVAHIPDTDDGILSDGRHCTVRWNTVCRGEHGLCLGDDTLLLHPCIGSEVSTADWADVIRDVRQRSSGNEWL